jgi:hypothetical protein
VRGDAGWRERFRLSPAGLAAAIFIFFFFAFLAIAFASMAIGMPNLFGTVIGLLVQGLSILALVIAIVVSKAILRSKAEVLPLLVPGIYAIVFYLIVASILSFVGGPIIFLLWIGLAFLLYRLARVATDWPVGTAAGFGALTVVLLVGMPVTLYMLLNSPNSPI